MDKKEIRKEYTNGEITVVWQSGKCIHSGICWRSLSAVFQPGERPWIKVEKADSSDIINTVAKCPSAALSIKDNDS
jgi:uncharacterized Fe-S cluster protein YjdI